MTPTLSTIMQHASNAEGRKVARFQEEADARLKEFHDTLDLHAKLFPKAVAALVPYATDSGGNHLQVWCLFTKSEKLGWASLMLHECPGALGVIESCLEDPGSVPPMLLLEDPREFRKECLKKVGKRIPGVAPAASFKGLQPEHVVMENVRAYLDCMMTGNFRRME